ncbi:c-type cytochrome [Niastella populi]|uniref:Cytochrome c domain-containing protein n=1 Tax=Niastella populi TaxID=550983 RepID=A0A1V9GAW9_9BACT|nr:cytochrome c [Niastella populi]OQP67702.1 hypothetical protein A4R26_11620 [Niastella populi]
MKKPLLVICLLATVIYACNHGNNTLNKLLNTGRLPAETFVIDISRDTILTTQKGAQIRIPKKAISADDNIVKLEVKEAYSMRDIVKAGLTTQSDGQPLSSGGMMYINAVSKNNARITQKIFVATPTPYLEKSMQLFKGEVQADSTINWTAPTPLPQNPQLAALVKGEIMFQNNCAACHAIDKHFTGPALGGVMARVLPVVGDKAHLYEFIRNPAKVMQTESYFLCLKNQYGGVVMTAFPNLTDEELDAIHGYIENEYKRINPNYDINLAACYDSCRLYNEVAGKWKQIKASLEKETVDLAVEKKEASPDTTGTLQKVSPDNQESLYYQFTIEAFGWYNIDMMLRNKVEVIAGELTVHIKSTDENKLNLYLVIPSLKVFESGGSLENETGSYGFLPLTARSHCRRTLKLT